MALVELSRVHFVEPGIYPPGRNPTRETVLLAQEDTNNRLRDRRAYRLQLDLEGRVILVTHLVDKSVVYIPLERVQQWEVAAVEKKVAAVK